MFSSVNHTIFYLFLILQFHFFSTKNPLSSTTIGATLSFFHVCSGSSCSHRSSLQFILPSQPCFTAPFFLFFHLSFLPSGSLGWCDAGCQSQRYMWYRVGGGGPGVWALWQRQQVQQLPDVCFYPQICPLDTLHFLPKYISLSESFLLSFSTSLPLPPQPLTKSYAFLHNLKWKPTEVLG